MKKIKKHNLILALAMIVFTAPMHANAADLNPATKLSIDASQKAVAGDYQGAINLYSQLIQLDPKDADHYIARGLLYRQIKNIPKSMGDGAMVLEIANYQLQKKNTGKRGAKSYWQRAQGYRLLEKFDLAQQDLQTAMRLRNDQRWMTDMQAIELESRMHDAK